MASTSESSCYTLINSSIIAGPHCCLIPHLPADLRTQLQSQNPDQKLDALRTIITQTLSGKPEPGLMMQIIQYCLPHKDKRIKKMLHFYWEVCPKYDEKGKLKQEMILVVNAVQKDLEHPNEYIRGATLRFMQKISRDTELLEPLVPKLRANLEHRHSYVRRNAIMALSSIYTANPDKELIPDAVELVTTFLVAESDSTCKRNAFLFLATSAGDEGRDRAIEWLAQQGEDGVKSMEEGLQLAVLEGLTRENKSKYLRIVFELLGAASHAVKYAAATTLSALSNNPTAIKSASQTLLTLARTSSDNNVKLIVLSRLDGLRKDIPGHWHQLILDLCNVLINAEIDVRKRALSLILAMTTGRNVEDVVGFLKKQVLSSVGREGEGEVEGRSLFIQNIHILAVKFPEVAPSVITDLLSFLGNTSGESSSGQNQSALDVVAFVREVLHKLPDLLFRGVLWILGDTLDAVRGVIGEVPILASEMKFRGEDGEEEGEDGSTEKEKEEKKEKRKPKVLADGTYATDVPTGVGAVEDISKVSRPPLRTLILGGDYFTSTVLSSTLTKLGLRFLSFSDKAATPAEKNALAAEIMLILTSVIRVGQSTLVPNPIDEDSLDRIMTCIQALATGDAEKTKVEEVFLKDSERAYEGMLGALERRHAESQLAKARVDEVLTFRFFRKEGEADSGEEEEDDLEGAVKEEKADVISDLKRITQLTGFSDPVYAEAYVRMQGFDIMLDVLLVNQTSATLQNLCLDFATLGDLKLVERPSVYTIAPNGFLSVKASIKVSSTETGVIFGSILWEGEKMEECCVVLNDIHVDIMDYIKPAWCNEAQFRSMWTEFEWENRVNVNNGVITDPLKYLYHVMKTTNMSCLTPMEGLKERDCDFLSANLYARSLFGEDALANLSVERKFAEGSGGEVVGVVGHVRIRSKTQGIALSLGDRISVVAKEAK
ncbi:coatomer protein [Flagelloscypha sp. PMI_526]|nr:coatomer protein [Flagelloscypha sp. PMI_526]